MNVNQDKDLKSSRKREEFNWLNTINFHLINSIMLSLGSIVFISFTFSQHYFMLSSFSAGFALIFFLASTELYISAKNHDLSAISKDQYELFNREYKMANIDWDKLKDKAFVLCKKKLKQASISYRIGLLLLFIGLFFTYGLSSIVFFAGIGFIIWLIIK